MLYQARERFRNPPKLISGLAGMGPSTVAIEPNAFDLYVLPLLTSLYLHVFKITVTVSYKDAVRVVKKQTNKNKP